MTNNCGNCQHYKPLSPGFAGICFEQWRYREWNEGVPLTSKDEFCNRWQAHGAAPPSPSETK